MIGCVLFYRLSREGREGLDFLGSIAGIWTRHQYFFGPGQNIVSVIDAVIGDNSPKSFYCVLLRKRNLPAHGSQAAAAFD